MVVKLLVVVAISIHEITNDVFPQFLDSLNKQRKLPACFSFHLAAINANERILNICAPFKHKAVPRAFSHTHKCLSTLSETLPSKPS
jgi:hypothetical protein